MREIEREKKATVAALGLSAEVMCDVENCGGECGLWHVVSRLGREWAEA